ncbi:MAG TPA: zinc-binding dehydrogenase, partial [Anaerolineales bacterium]|nr:zinc-binding dehydrogenase [Anaerolineales bacterium]
SASRPESREWVLRQGAHRVVDHHQPLREQLESAGHPVVDHILCLKNVVQHWPAMVDLVAPFGKICLVDDIEAPVNFGALHGKSVTVVCENIFTRANYQTADLVVQHQILTTLAALVDAGSIHSTLVERLTPIDATTLRLAHARLERGDVIGKIAIEGFERVRASTE